LLTPRLAEAAEYPELGECVDCRWGDFLRAAGCAALTASLAANPGDLAALPGLAGVVLTGGGDIAAVSDSRAARRRDAFEAALVLACGRADVPVLGVCRGAQFLAHRHGASLVRAEGHAGTRHGLVPAQAPWPELAGAVQVNSYHNWAIAPGGNIRPAALSDQGHIEAFSTHDGALGIMWHPERASPFQGRDITLIQRLFHVQKDS